MLTTKDFRIIKRSCINFYFTFGCYFFSNCNIEPVILIRFGLHSDRLGHFLQIQVVLCEQLKKKGKR